MGEITDDSIDYLTCGKCLSEFPLKNIVTFIEHKKKDCDVISIEDTEPGLLCSACSKGFMTAVGLLKHAKISHNLQLFLESGPYRGGVLASGTRNESLDVNETPVNLVTRSTAVPQDDVERDGEKAQENPSLSGLVSTSDISEYCLSGLVCSGADNPTVPMVTVSPNDSPEDSPASVRRTPVKVGSENLTSAQISPIQDNGTLIRNPDTTYPGNTGDNPVEEASSEGREDIAGEAVEGEDACCSSQKCGVTVIPGTHESLKKCCYAVAPKKRKRHMETKHMSSYWRTRLNRRRMLNVREASSRRPTNRSQGTIYIDLKPESGVVSTTHSENQTSTDTTTNLNDSSGDSMGIHVTGMTRDSTSRANSQKPSRGSFLIKPRAVFSIPISYTIPAQALDADKSIQQDTKSILDEGFQHSSDSVTFKDQNSAVSSSGSGCFPLNSSSAATSMTSESHIYGIDLPSLISQATRQFNLVPGSSECGEISDKDLQSHEDGDGKLGRKRRYPTTKPYKCEQCDNAFNQRIHLKKHMSKHTGIKPFKCQQCDYSTVERSHLKVHIRIHTGEKPFKCTFCEYATAQNSTLKIHLKRHHGRQRPDEKEGEQSPKAPQAAAANQSAVTMESSQDGGFSTNSNIESKKNM